MVVVAASAASTPRPLSTIAASRQAARIIHAIDIVEDEASKLGVEKVGQYSGETYKDQAHGDQV